MGLWALWLWFGLAQIVFAQDPPAEARSLASSLPAAPWYVGKPVGMVSLVAVDGGLPPEYLEPLLRVRQGQPLSVGDIREDVGLLYRAASFLAVEAVVEPWPAQAPDGSIVDGVRVEYQVVPPSTLQRVSIDGPAGPARRLARRALSAHRGEALFPEDDIPIYTERVRKALFEAGWTDAEVTLDVAAVGPRESALTLTVLPGEPHRYGRIDVMGDIVQPQTAGCLLGELGGRFSRRVQRQPKCGVSDARVRRWLRREGVHEGARVEQGQFDQAMIEVRRKLVKRGWLGARIGFVGGGSALTDSQSEHAVRIEGGPRLILHVDRARSFRERVLPTAGQLQETLGLFGGERLDDQTLEESAARLEAWLDARGYIAAAAELEARSVERGIVLDIAVDPGRRHVMTRIDVTGSSTFSPAFITGAIKEAGFASSGRDMSMAGLAKGLDAVQDVYRGAGHLEAAAIFEGLTPRPTRLAWLFRRRRLVRTAVRVRVREGPRTTLASLDVFDSVGLASPIVVDAVRELEGQPYSQASLERLERLIVSHYQSVGYINADTELEVDVGASDHLARARIQVRPGVQVRLRSVIVRGNRRVRRKVITRELTLEVGEPVTPKAIADSRSALYDLGLFRAISPELVGDDDRTRDLVISVDERRNILLEGGGRIASDQGVLATMRATHRNIGGLGHNLSIYGQLGYGWLADEWVVDTQAPVWRVATRYTAPWVPGRGHNLILEGLLREVSQSPSFRIQRSGARVGLRSKYGDHIETFIDYNAQVRMIENVDPGALISGDPWLPLLGLEDGLHGELTVPSQNRYQAGPELLFLVDGRDDQFNPTQGAYFSSQFWVSDGLMSDIVSLRGDVRLETFLSVGPVVVDWFGRVAGGRARGQGSTLPIEDRFYLGGAGSMRGYRLNAVGPANFAARPNLGMPQSIEPALEGKALRNAPGHWVWTGGDALFQTTLELRMPLSVLGLKDLDSTNLFLFSDVGQVRLLDDAVSTTSAEFGLDRPFRYSIGTGLRVATPIGPAAIAIGINPSPIQAWDEPTILPHLTLGEL